MRRAAPALALSLALAGCATPPGLRPFSTDRCSLFPDRAPAGEADWCACCVTHDLAYWRGGTEAERLRADRELERCVLATTGDATLAAAMFHGVRAGGTPALPTSFRWGYGWPYERGYRALTPDEQALAGRLAADARPAAACTPP